MPEPSPIASTAAARAAAPSGPSRLCRIGHRGFTLLELLVVMVILGLLAGYVGPKLFAQIGKSEAKVARAQIDALGKALDQYRLDVGRYPSTAQGLAALTQPPAGEPRWAGPYLARALPPDPWGRPYGYRAPGEHGDYDLWSEGPDGAPGSEAATGLRNW
ncbi:MAG: type II secretion system major pseudopilin GspG [Rubrivivax sp.]|nr:type II secretion system major pseudopilin GspG [Rubrivivax sp.]